MRRPANNFTHMKFFTRQSKITQRLLVGFATLVLVLGGSLLQQQVLKVKADVQVLLVSDTALPFGTVFPGEELSKTYTVQLDTSASSSTYVTTLVPPSTDEQDPLFGRKDLCPYLQLKNIDNPTENDTPAESSLSKPNDTIDNWQIKLTVPAIEGHVAQDHTGGIVVTGGDFGCRISITTDTNREITGTKFNDVDANGKQGDGEQGLSGWTIYAGKLVQDLDVQSMSELATTTVPLENGKKYFLRASGTFDAGDSITADAMYSTRTASTTWTDSVQNYESYGPTLLDLQINGSSPDWGSFNPNHVYWHTVIGTGSPLSLGIYDIYYPNNTGALNVKLYEVVAEALTDASGNYSLNLSNYSGDVVVAEQTKTGWLETMPAPDGFYTVATSTSAAGRDFGNHSLDQGGCEGPDCGGGGNGQADLSVVKTVDKASINTNDPITYSFTVHNLGPDVATNVVMTDVVPAAITVLTSTSTLGSYSTSTGQWAIGTLNVGSSTTLSISGTVGSVNAGQVVVNTATVHADQADPDLSNNTSSATSAAPGGGGGCTSNCGGGGGGGGTSGAAISGQKFNDLNLNGQKDAGEPGLPGWIIYLDTNGNKQLDTGEPYTFTDAQGNYTFGNVSIGTVHVREVEQADWTQTRPGLAQDFEYVLTTAAGGSYSGIDFGNTRAQVAGSSVTAGPEPQVAGASTSLPKTGLPPDMWLYLAMISLAGSTVLVKKPKK